MERGRQDRTIGPAGAGRGEAAHAGKRTLTEALPAAETAQPAGAGHGGGIRKLDLGATPAGTGWGLSEMAASASSAISGGASKMASAIAGAPSAIAAAAGVVLIKHATQDTAPGAANTRTTVAVGEIVSFESNMDGKWKASSAGAGAKKTGTGAEFHWVAPSTKGTFKITFDPGDKKLSTTTIPITVIEPTVDYKNARATAFPGQAAGVAGVQMDSDVTFGPDTVSFANTAWWEKPGPATNATGYFLDHVQKRKKKLPYHKPNPDDLEIDTTNSGPVDSAGWWDFNGPFSAGSFDWVIPTYYRVLGDKSRHKIADVTQKCTIGADGTMTVTKGSATKSRTP